jgi:hypothetical protein
MSTTVKKTGCLPILAAPDPGTAFVLSLAILCREASGVVATTLPGRISGVERDDGKGEKKVKVTGRVTEKKEGRKSVHGCQYMMVPQ